MDGSTNLKGYTLDTLRDRFQQQGVAAYRANQVISWLYRRGVDDPLQMTDLSLYFPHNIHGLHFSPIQNLYRHFTPVHFRIPH